MRHRLFLYWSVCLIQSNMISLIQKFNSLLNFRIATYSITINVCYLIKCLSIKTNNTCIFQDGSMVDECNSPYVKTNIIVLNDSPDEIVSSPHQTPSIRKDKTKLIKSIYKNHNKSKRLISNNNRSRILESENANNLIRRNSFFIVTYA